MKPLISIIIPVKNASKTIQKCIDSILNLNYPEYEIIIIDDGSTDDTSSLLNNYFQSGRMKNYRYIKINSSGPSKARNIGIDISNGEFVAFTDADCIIDREWLNELLKGFESYDEKIAGVGGEQLSPDDDTDFCKSINDFMKKIGFITDYIKTIENHKKQNFKFIETNHNPTCNVIYKKEIFKKVGGFLDGLWPGEDVELDYRIKKYGYKLLFNPKAIVYHYRPETIEKFSKMMFNYGKVQAFLVKKYGFFRKIHFVPIIFFPVLIFSVFYIFYNFKIFLILFLFFNIICFLFFILKNVKLKKIIQFCFFNYITLFSWNSGFLYGVFTNFKSKK